MFLFAQFFILLFIFHLKEFLKFAKLDFSRTDGNALMLEKTGQFSIENANKYVYNTLSIVIRLFYYYRPLISASLVPRVLINHPYYPIEIEIEPR